MIVSIIVTLVVLFGLLYATVVIGFIGLHGGEEFSHLPFKHYIWYIPFCIILSSAWYYAIPALLFQIYK